MKREDIVAALVDAQSRAERNASWCPEGPMRADRERFVEAFKAAVEVLTREPAPADTPDRMLREALPHFDDREISEMLGSWCDECQGQTCVRPHDEPAPDVIDALNQPMIGKRNVVATHRVTAPITPAISQPIDQAVDRAKDNCVFCAIVTGHSPAHIVRKWDDAVAFVPLGPVVPGHLLVVPHSHVDDARTDSDVTGLAFRRASDLAGQLGGDFNLIANAGPAAGQTVFHLHVHIVPRLEGDGLRLPWTPVEPAPSASACQHREVLEEARETVVCAAAYIEANRTDIATDCYEMGRKLDAALASAQPCATPAGCQHRESLREAFDALPRECCKTDPDLLDRIEATLGQPCAAPVSLAHCSTCNNEGGGLSEFGNWISCGDCGNPPCPADLSQKPCAAPGEAGELAHEHVVGTDHCHPRLVIAECETINEKGYHDLANIEPGDVVRVYRRRSPERSPAPSRAEQVAQAIAAVHGLDVPLCLCGHDERDHYRGSKRACWRARECGCEGYRAPEREGGGR